jgi:hypothetical protein
MSIQAVAWALEQQLPAAAKLVLVSIANHADHEDGYCYLRAETIGREASCTPRHAQRVVAALVRNGFLRKRIRRGADGKQRANDYWILFDGARSETWSWRALGDSEADTDAAQDVTNLPHDIESSGKSDECTPESSGPHDSGVTAARHTSRAAHNVEPSEEEPSESNKTKKNRNCLAVKEGLRAYRPPPDPQDVVADVHGEVPSAMRVFVIEGTPAWRAWSDYRRRIGRPLNHSYSGAGPYAGKTGRHFPSLFPPKSESTGPPGTLLTDDDVAYLGERMGTMTG